MKTYSKLIVASSLLMSLPVLADGSHFVTAGFGTTDYELTQEDATFTESDWLDFEVGYTYRAESEWYLNVRYRSSLDAESDTFHNGDEYFTTDLEDSRFAVAAGIGMFYIGWLNYDTTISAPTTSDWSGPLDLDYSLSGFTLGLQHSWAIGNSAHRFQAGLGGLYASADVDQDNTSGSGYHVEYDDTFGWFAGVGIGGPISTSGLIYDVRYEYQTIEFDSITDFDASALEDTRSRFSANLTYMF